MIKDIIWIGKEENIPEGYKKVEFNLSEKIKGFVEEDGNNTGAVLARDVKEFIKRGEEIIRRTDLTNEEKVKEIRKLVGEKLL